MEKACVFSDSDTGWISSPDTARRIIELAAEYQDCNPAAVRLRHHGRPDAGILNHAMDQVEARRHFRTKLPLFCFCPEFLFPSALSGEQASAEHVADLHGKIADGILKTLNRNTAAGRILDMTAGLGVDSFLIARNSPEAEITAFELDPLKAAALKHNAASLGFGNISVRNEDSLAAILSSDMTADIIFADPARRGMGNRRVFDPADCLPDVVGNNEALLGRCSALMVKHSPMLDITRARGIFPSLRRICVVSLRGDCKEVLTIQSRGAEFLGVVCIDIDARGDMSDYCVLPEFLENPGQGVRYAEMSDIIPGSFLYEPSPTVMKTGAWSSLAAGFPDLLKADRNTHLFVSSTDYPEFPGRRLRIMSVPDRKERASVKGSRLNVVARNYVASAAELESTLRLKPSAADEYLYAFRCSSKPVLVIAKALSGNC